MNLVDWTTLLTVCNACLYYIHLISHNVYLYLLLVSGFLIASGFHFSTLLIVRQFYGLYPYICLYLIHPLTWTKVYPCFVSLCCFVKFNCTCLRELGAGL